MKSFWYKIINYDEKHRAINMKYLFLKLCRTASVNFKKQTKMKVFEIFE